MNFDYRLGGWGSKGSISWLRNIWMVPNQRLGFRMIFNSFSSYFSFQLELHIHNVKWLSPSDLQNSLISRRACTLVGQKPMVHLRCPHMDQKHYHHQQWIQFHQFYYPVSLQLKMKLFSMYPPEGETIAGLNVSFPGSWETWTGFSQPQVHTVMVGRSSCP